MKDYWKPKLPESGCYLIFNTKSKKCYIGSSKHISWRIYQHVRLLRFGRHINPHLQAAWNKYGEDAFEIKIVARCEEKARFSIERTLVGSFDSMKNGYNLRSPEDLEITEITRQRMSDATFGGRRPRTGSHSKKHTDQAKKKMSNKQTGENNARCKLTDDQVDEIRVRISLGHKYKDIAKDFGVSQGHIGFIKLGWSRAKRTPDGFKQVGPVIRQNVIALADCHIAHMPGFKNQED